MAAVTVAIPVLDGMPLLEEVLGAVNRQRVDRDVELLVCDSHSRDASAEAAARHGARVLRIDRGEFGHGRTRNLLMREARGAHVAFLTQDATPADEHWLQRLLDAFTLAPDVALVTGPYLPRPGAPVPLVREAEAYFAAMHDGRPHVVRGDAGLGPASFYSDANGGVLREAWERVPFRDVAYAEDRRLARDMLAAGYAKVFVPGAAVVHSHDYPFVERFQRWFDEFRALREVDGFVADAHPRRLAGHVRREVARDLAYARAHSLRASARQSVGYHGARALAAAAGTRAGALPGSLRRRLSLERRATFEPLDLF